MDGRPRADGVRESLRSRAIELPEGAPDDVPGAETVNGLGNRKNELVLKIIDAHLVLAMHLCGDSLTPEQKAHNFAYEARTVRDSSLSAGTQAVMAAEVGHLEPAYDYLAEAALTDLHDLHDNVRNGLHMASLAGAWQGAVAGFGGMRDHGETLSFAPRLPPLDRITFRLTFRDTRFQVEIDRDHATYRVLEGKPLDVLHHGDPITLTTEPQRFPIPRIEGVPRLRSRPGARRSAAIPPRCVSSPVAITADPGAG